MSVTTLPDLNLLPAEALKALVLAQHEQLLWRESEVEQLKLLIAKLQRMQFGRKSEKLDRQIEKLECRLEDLLAEEGPVGAESPAIKRAASARTPLPAELPREDRIVEPEDRACPRCGGNLKPLGEDISE